ncbi:MAG TPA: thioesterase domain-containing protein [Cryptosporangiaceae bacterium]|nr:thioesterase domain-containing protein [Cryptosporangiaceae bacterium]
MSPPSTKWLLREPSSGDGPLLFCFPYGGAGASSLRRWPGRIGEIEVQAVQLPGRENRISEQPYGDFDTFARDAVEALGPYLDRPYAVIGHCMGALLAHAFVARTQDAGAPRPRRLFVSASLVPYRGFYGFYHPWMSDRRIARELQRVSRSLGDDELPAELVSLSIRVLRADVLMCLGYLPPTRPVDVPISAIGWDGDADVDEDDVAEWEEYGQTRAYLLPGEPVTFLAAPSGVRNIVEDDFEF